MGHSDGGQERLAVRTPERQSTPITSAVVNADKKQGCGRKKHNPSSRRPSEWRAAAKALKLTVNEVERRSLGCFDAKTRAIFVAVTPPSPTKSVSTTMRTLDPRCPALSWR